MTFIPTLYIKEGNDWQYQNTSVNNALYINQSTSDYRLPNPTSSVQTVVNLSTSAYTTLYGSTSQSGSTGGSNILIYSMAMDYNNNILYYTYRIYENSNYISRISKINLETNTITNIAKFSDIYNTKFLLINNNILYVCGNFINVLDITTSVALTTSPYIAQYNLNTGIWSNMGGGFSAQCVYMYYFNNEIYFCGDFNNILATPSAILASKIAKYNLNTGIWSNVSSSIINSTVRSIVISNNIIYIGGNFTQIGSISRLYLAKYDITLSTWSNILSNNLNSYVQVITLNNSSLYIGGQFSLYGTSVANVIKYDIINNLITLYNFSSIGITSIEIDNINNIIYTNIQYLHNEVYYNYKTKNINLTTAQSVVLLNNNTMNLFIGNAFILLFDYVQNIKVLNTNGSVLYYTSSKYEYINLISSPDSSTWNIGTLLTS